jgi:hypothetical protein
MLSKEIKKLYDDGQIDIIYKKNLKYFELIDEWAEKLIGGNLLDEYELSQCMEQLNGCQSKLNPIAGCLEAMVVEYENRYMVKEESDCEKDRIQDQNSCKAKAREKASDLRRYASDFTRYTYSCQNTVTVAQSRLKRLSVEKANKGVDYTGEVPQEEKNDTGSKNGAKNGW